MMIFYGSLMHRVELKEESDLHTGRCVCGGCGGAVGVAWGGGMHDDFFYGSLLSSWNKGSACNHVLDLSLSLDKFKRGPQPL